MILAIIIGIPSLAIIAWNAVIAWRLGTYTIRGDRMHRAMRLCFLLGNMVFIAALVTLFIHIPWQDLMRENSPADLIEKMKSALP